MTSQALTPLVEFKEEDHTYFHDGKRVPSVTEILKGCGFIVGMEFVDDYSVWKGQALHRAIELHNKGTLDESTIPPIVMPGFQAFLEFEKATGFIVDGFEQRVFRPELWFAGTLDLAGHFPDGKKGIGDVKGGIVKPWTKYQVALYAVGAGDSYCRRFAIGLAGGKPKIHEFKDINDITVALGAVAVHNAKMNMGISAR